MGNRVSTRDLGLILGQRLLKTEHLHYGYWGDGLALTLGNLAQAQEAYAAFLLPKIPQGTRTVLDVGCGTGSMAELLLQKGHQVEGVSPSPVLSEFVRRRLGPDFTLHTTTLEALATPKTYDLLLFSESFQYIDPALSLPKAHGLLNPGGHILICDFFSTDAPGASALRGGHRLSAFYRLLEAQPFDVVFDEDITERMAPNLQVVDDWLQDYALPVWEALGYYLRSNYPRLSRLAHAIFRRKLEKLHFKYFSHQRTAENFAKFKSYRCMLLQRQD